MPEMDFSTFVGGNVEAHITPAMIAQEVRRVLALEGYFESVAYGFDFRSGVTRGATWWRMEYEIRIGDVKVGLTLRPRHLSWTLDKFLVEILWPHLEPFIFRDE